MIKLFKIDCMSNASGFFKNPMRECENKTHSMKNYTEFSGSKDKVPKALFSESDHLFTRNCCVCFCQNSKNPTRSLTQNIQSILNDIDIHTK